MYCMYTFISIIIIFTYTLTQLAVQEITAGHWPFSNQIQHLADLIYFGWPNLWYILNGKAFDNLQYVPSSKNGQPISDLFLLLQL